MSELKWPPRWMFVPSPRRESAVTENAARLCREGARPVVRLCGELDLASAASVRAALNEACQDASGEVLVDLSDVQFFDAVTMGIFAQANERLHKTGGRLALLGLSPQQEMLLCLCSLEHLLAVGRSRDSSTVRVEDVVLMDRAD